MRRLAIGTVAVAAAIGLSGCLGFNNEPRGKQIAAKRVQVAFSVCRGSATPTCSDQSSLFENGFSRILIGLRVKNGTVAPETIRSLNEGIPFDRSAEYTSELNETAPRSAQHNRWVGWVTRERRANDDWPDVDGFRIKLRLPDRHGRYYRYRPVVGYQEVPEVGPEEPITCGGDALEPDGTATATCIDAPNGDEARTNLKFRIERARR